MRLLVLLCALICFGPKFAHAKTYTISSLGPTSNKLVELPPSDLPVYVALAPSLLTTSDGCDKIHSDWLKLIHVKDMDASGNVGFYLVFQCDLSSATQVSVWTSGYIWALNQPGADLITSYFEEVLTLDNGQFVFDKAVASGAGITLQFDGSRDQSAIQKGFLNVPFAGSKSYLDHFQSELAATDSLGRRKILSDLLHQLNSTFSDDQINQVLNSNFDSTAQIEMDYFPIFSTAYGTYAEFGQVWNSTYVCSAAGKCY